VNTFYTVPSGVNGGSIWSSPAVNAATNTVFVSTGNPGRGAVPNYTEAIIALNASTLAVQSSWQIPASQAIADSDFGATPTLFQNSTGVALVASTNKNGYTYVLRQANLALGPVWESKTSGGGDSVAAAAFANGVLFIAGPHSKINGGNVSGTVRALNPNTWSFTWQTGLWGREMAAPSYANGLIEAPTAGHWLFLLNATNGKMLRHLSLPGGLFGTVAIYDGLLIFGCANGHVYAYG
jgi:hypothetical protein